MSRVPVALLLALVACGSPTDPSDDTDSDTAAACTAPGSPTGLDALDERAFPRSIPALTWSAPGDGCADGYEVAVGADGAAADTLDWMAVSSTSFDGVLDELLPADTALIAHVRATWQGEASEPVSVEVGETFSPADLPGLVLWIDAASPDVFKDASCTTRAEPGDAVQCVRDRSSHAHVLQYEPNVGPAPKLVTHGDLTAIDFRGGAVLFTPTSDALEIDGTDLVLALVDAPDDVDANGTNKLPNYVLNKERAYEFAYWEDRFQAAIETGSPGVWQWSRQEPAAASAGQQQNTFIYDGVNYTFRESGTQTAQITAPEQGAITGEGSWRPPGAPSDIPGSPLVLGGRPAGITASYRADLDELLLFGGELGAGEIEDVERYLVERWGL